MDTPLIAVAENGHDNCVAQLLKAGVDVNLTDDMGNTALMWASMTDHWKCVSALLGTGVDVNKANNHGDISLMCAARKGDEQGLSELISAGADVNKVNKLGNTSFTIARSKHHEQCMTILTTGGAGVNMSDLHSRESVDGLEIIKADTTIEMANGEGELNTSKSMSLKQECVLSKDSDTAMKADSVK